MKKYITKIDAILVNTEKKVSIDLQGKNLIITGGNGCGKTQFLNQIFSHLKVRLNSNQQQQYKNQLSQVLKNQNALNTPNLNSLQEKNYQTNIDNLLVQINRHLHHNDCHIELNDMDDVTEKVLQKKLLLRLYTATRQYGGLARNNQNETVLSMQQTAQNQDLLQDSSITFESYLVTYLNAGYMAYVLRKDEEEKNKVDAWLEVITSDLRYLFEDETLVLEYKEKEKIFYVNQKGKTPFTFSQLSSGYSSILNIYADLLMKVELRGITAKELSGIAIIDEIDAHLHVSLQKKILSFLDNAYPNVQFIVSTHSPFVIQSVDNAVIYDLSRLEQLEDLSMYSYEAITKGLLGVKTTSNSLDDLVSELSKLTPEIESNKARIESLVAMLSTNESELDSRSKVVLLMGKQAILDSDLKGE
ncbi:AAA family ATPase [Psychromonas ossibalaenae]|uniref:AAA family ATPase n=1 Tax=Psychromonas ossibalaenae TaxID=444922 RepID=UPI00036BE64B|nr:AAA family ATPase [Psychromonas ossibalaenae]